MKRINTVPVGRYTVGEGQPLLLFAGPCVIESEKNILQIAEKLKALSEKLHLPLVFKASYDKANRTALTSYRGPGLEAGLRILEKAGREFELPLITDVHRPEDFQAAAEVVDVVQVPAFLCRQTDMLVAAARCGKTVNIKKGQFMSPSDMGNAVAKVVESGNDNVLLTDRGASFGYNTLITDMRAIPQMQSFCPVVFDATHSVQQPGGLGGASGGQREFVETLARAAAAAGMDALFMEVHPEPAQALSDAASMFPLDSLEAFLKRIQAIAALIRDF